MVAAPQVVHLMLSAVCVQPPACKLAVLRRHRLPGIQHLSGPCPHLPDITVLACVQLAPEVTSRLCPACA